MMKGNILRFLKLYKDVNIYFEELNQQGKLYCRIKDLRGGSLENIYGLNVLQSKQP